MKDVLRYTKGTKEVGLLYKRSSHFNIIAWSDADWARDQDNRKSRSGIVITIGNNPVIWFSRLQSIVATSTAEAEFYALSECTKAVKWT